MSQNLLATRRFAPFFWTQALGAFNDNVVKNALVILVTFGIAGLSEGQRALYVNLAAGIFILPIFLFSATSGQIAEKYEKSLLIRRIKLLEVAIALLAAVGFWLGSPAMLLGVLFLLGAQATLFGPVKYSILPQHLKPEELIAGNAWVEAGTFIAILLGTMLGGWLITLPNGGVLVGAAAVAFALAGWATSLGVPQAPAAARRSRHKRRQRRNRRQPGRQRQRQLRRPSQLARGKACWAAPCWVWVWARCSPAWA